MLMTFAIALWILIALGVLALYVYRTRITANEDDTLHVDHMVERTADQQVLAARLGPVDKWGKTLTVVAAAYGLIIALYWVVVNFTDASRGLG
jgi:hypothetical protein